MGIHENENANDTTVKGTNHALSTQFEQTRSKHKAYINKTYKENWKEKCYTTKSSKLLENTDNTYTLLKTSCESL